MVKQAGDTTRVKPYPVEGSDSKARFKKKRVSAFARRSVKKMVFDEIIQSMAFFVRSLFPFSTSSPEASETQMDSGSTVAGAEKVTENGSVSLFPSSTFSPQASETQTVSGFPVAGAEKVTEKVSVFPFSSPTSSPQASKTLTDSGFPVAGRKKETKNGSVFPFPLPKLPKPGRILGFQSPEQKK